MASVAVTFPRGPVWKDWRCQQDKAGEASCTPSPPEKAEPGTWPLWGATQCTCCMVLDREKETEAALRLGAAEVGTEFPSCWESMATGS